MYLIGCLQQPIRCTDEQSIIVQIHKKPIQCRFFFECYVNDRVYQRLITSNRVCRGSGVWCWKTRNSPRNQAQHHWQHPSALNVLKRIFKVLGDLILNLVFIFKQLSGFELQMRIILYILPFSNKDGFSIK